LKTCFYFLLLGLRFCRLAKLGLLPTFFGQSIHGVVKQKYHGDVTMVPKFTPMESIGLKVRTVAVLAHVAVLHALLLTGPAQRRC
jgi:hypothetical protein